MGERLYVQLGRKLDKEILEYRQKVKEKGVDYAIDSAYELTVKNELKDCLLYDKIFTDEEIKALLSRKNLLDETYFDWLKADGNLREDLNYVLDKSINFIAKEYREEKKNKNYER